MVTALIPVAFRVYQGVFVFALAISAMSEVLVTGGLPVLVYHRMHGAEDLGIITKVLSETVSIRKTDFVFAV
jgi:hypothetical protein